MIKRFSNSLRNDDADIDVTPMLDVVFIMLIFFIVTASFVTEKGIGLNKPASIHSESSNPPQLIVVHVTNLGEILVDNRIVDHRSIRPTIIRLKAENPYSSVIVKVDAKAKTKKIIQAVDGIRAANVEMPAVTLAQM